jgi:ribonucleoside-diphosphate reductase alpha chain
VEMEADHGPSPETADRAAPTGGAGVPEDPWSLRLQEDAPPCHECGAIMVRNGACYKCLNCGATSGCS